MPARSMRKPGGPRVLFRIIRGELLGTLDSQFRRAAEFAQTVGPERLISISHSVRESGSIVTVWYWSRLPKAVPGQDAAELPLEVDPVEEPVSDPSVAPEADADEET